MHARGCGMNTWSCNLSPMFAEQIHQWQVGLGCKHKVLTYIEYGVASSVFRTFDPPPPLHPASGSSPRTKGGGVHTRRAVRGWGTIFRKTPDIGLASYSLIPLRLQVHVYLYPTFAFAIRISETDHYSRNDIIFGKFFVGTTMIASCQFGLSLHFCYTFQYLRENYIEKQHARRGIHSYLQSRKLR
jgi:hypothetical protein